MEEQKKANKENNWFTNIFKQASKIQTIPQEKGPIEKEIKEFISKDTTSQEVKIMIKNKVLNKKFKFIIQKRENTATFLIKLKEKLFKYTITKEKDLKDLKDLKDQIKSDIVLIIFQEDNNNIPNFYIKNAMMFEDDNVPFYVGSLMQKYITNGNIFYPIKGMLYDYSNHKEYNINNDKCQLYIYIDYNFEKNLLYKKVLLEYYKEKKEEQINNTDLKKKSQALKQNQEEKKEEKKEEKEKAKLIIDCDVNNNKEMVRVDIKYKFPNGEIDDNKKYCYVIANLNNNKIVIFRNVNVKEEIEIPQNTKEEKKIEEIEKEKKEFIKNVLLIFASYKEEDGDLDEFTDNIVKEIKEKQLQQKEIKEAGAQDDQLKIKLINKESELNISNNANSDKNSNLKINNQSQEESQNENQQSQQKILNDKEIQSENPKIEIKNSQECAPKILSYKDNNNQRFELQKENQQSQQMILHDKEIEIEIVERFPFNDFHKKKYPNACMFMQVKKKKFQYVIYSLKDDNQEEWKLKIDFDEQTKKKLNIPQNNHGTLDQFKSIMPLKKEKSKMIKKYFKMHYYYISFQIRTLTETLKEKNYINTKQINKEIERLKGQRSILFSMHPEYKAYMSEKMIEELKQYKNIYQEKSQNENQQNKNTNFLEENKKTLQSQLSQ